MKIVLKSGMGGLLFGMKEKDVKAVLGNPDRQFKDEEKNIIYLYDTGKLRLTFYADEEFKLGYIITSSKDARLKSENIIGEQWAVLEPKLKAHGLTSFEKETFDSADNYFNEANWVIFQVEFNEVIRLELGAAITAKDEFDWKF